MVPLHSHWPFWGCTFSVGEIHSLNLMIPCMVVDVFITNLNIENNTWI